MLELSEWFTHLAGNDRPWLMVGKGPSLARVREADLDRFRVITLNHAIDHLHAEVAHVADLDVLEACSDRIAHEAEWLLMPRVPHRDLAPDRPLAELLAHFPVLADFDRRNRLVWYNLHTAPPSGDSPVIGCRWFGSESVLEILGHAGASVVRTLGIDRGTGYASVFEGLETTRLNNGAPNFDVQFFELERIAEQFGIDVAPTLEPLQVFVGSDPSQHVAFRVLEHSIRTHCSQPVDIHDLGDFPTAQPADPENRGRTDFSFCRFRIPELCNYRGRALYLDADMLVFADISELWGVPFGEHKVQCTVQDAPPQQWEGSEWFHPGRQLSVMMLDCDRLDWKIDEVIDGLDKGSFSYAELMFELCLLDTTEIGGDLPREWNHLEHYEPGVTKLVHFTVVEDQPWKVDGNSLEPLWRSALEQALIGGTLSVDELVEAVDAGVVKASLAHALALVREPNHATGNHAAARAHITLLQGESARLSKRVAQLERRLQAQRTTLTWRTGRAVLAPVRALRRAIGSSRRRA